MNFEEAVTRACKETTIDDALTFICIWESERIVQFVKDHPNQPWETMFKCCITAVRADYPENN